MAPRIITVEGTIASGKSTAIAFFRRVLDPSRCLFFEEPLHIWTNLTTNQSPYQGPNLLEDFYTNPRANFYAFQTAIPIIFQRKFMELYQVSFLFTCSKFTLICEHIY